MITDLASYDPERTYTTAAHDYDAALEQFWGFCARNTIERLLLQPGDRVLDVACGPGPAALRAAERVRPDGRVEGVDISEEMLTIARRHAHESGLDNVTFTRGDMDSLPYDTESFDAVTMVLGLFFAKDIVGTLTGLWRLVRPGGTLAITTLGPKFFHPMFDVFLDAVRAERPDLELSIPWQRTEDPDTLRTMLLDAGIPNPAVTDELTPMALPNPQAWWRIVRGTGIRRIEMELDDDTSARVRRANEQWIVDHELTSLVLGVNYATATKK
ncbi:class I SAM-dependent methyltransferase [Candidatus Protofrankia californiensis]|uniref:class I SAM-dependent methyltransferase n=1 Tax=Candidatus Protofrankia californiensis TaxID=1839754 RepID=UPI0010414756|nr:methyltransferase domain-containing protein [Candidatus Protofrankia californiensis]